MKDVYGDLHPSLDRTVEVGVTYNPATRTWTKETRLTPNIAIQNESVVGGSLFHEFKLLTRGSFNLGPVNADLDILAPLDKTITNATNAHLKLNLKDYFVAADVDVSNFVSL